MKEYYKYKNIRYTHLNLVLYKKNWLLKYFLEEKLIVKYVLNGLLQLITLYF